MITELTNDKIVVVRIALAISLRHIIKEDPEGSKIFNDII